MTPPAINLGYIHGWWCHLCLKLCSVFLELAIERFSSVLSIVCPPFKEHVLVFVTDEGAYSVPHIWLRELEGQLPSSPCIFFTVNHLNVLPKWRKKGKSIERYWISHRNISPFFPIHSYATYYPDKLALPAYINVLSVNELVYLHQWGLHSVLLWIHQDSGLFATRKIWRFGKESCVCLCLQKGTQIRWLWPHLCISLPGMTKSISGIENTTS